MREGMTLLKEVACAGLSAWDAARFLEKVTNAAPCIIYIFNQQTQSNEYCNRSLGLMLGYTPEEIREMGSTLVPRLCHPEDLPKIYIHFEKLKTLSDGEIAEVEYRVKNKAGGWIWLVSYDTVFDRDADGKLVRHVGIADDITEKKLAEERVSAEKRVADAANEELRSFAYSVSHDLKSPSNTLQLLLTELRNQHALALDEDAHELIDLSLATVGRMKKLVDDVLYHTRVVSWHRDQQRVDLKRLVSDIVNDMAGDIREARATVEVGDLPEVSGSKAQLRILFLNLISNALKFRKPDVPPVIEISKTNEQYARRFEITVKDNGIGIPEESHELIFGMFKRLHVEGEYPGTGVGLSTCQRIAINHGEKITVRSEVGRSSAFSVRLPRP